MNLTFLTQLIDASKIGGWVRAATGMAFVAAIAKWPILGNYVDPATQVQIAAAIATIAVGYWSTLTKTDSAKIAAVEAIPAVASISVKPWATDGVAEALDDPTRPKVVAAGPKAA